MAVLNFDLTPFAFCLLGHSLAIPCPLLASCVGSVLPDCRQAAAQDDRANASVQRD